MTTSCSVSSLGWVCARESQKVATLSQDTRAVTSSTETRVVMNTSTTLHLQCNVVLELSLKHNTK